MTDMPPNTAERMAAPLALATGDEADIIGDAWAEYGRTGDRETLFDTLASVYEVVTDLPPPDDPRPFPTYIGGEAGERLALAHRRWRESDYDGRLRPQAHPDAEQQALYDAYDRGEWPPPPTRTPR